MMYLMSLSLRRGFTVWHTAPEPMMPYQACSRWGQQGGGVMEDGRKVDAARARPHLHVTRGIPSQGCHQGAGPACARGRLWAQAKAAAAAAGFAERPYLTPSACSAKAHSWERRWMSAYVVMMVGPSGSFDTTCSAVDSQHSMEATAMQAPLACTRAGCADSTSCSGCQRAA